MSLLVHSVGIADHDLDMSLFLLHVLQTVTKMSEQLLPYIRYEG